MLRNVARPLEHGVLEEAGEAAEAGGVSFGADAVLEHEGHGAR